MYLHIVKPPNLDWLGGLVQDYYSMEAKELTHVESIAEGSELLAGAGVL